MGDSVEDLENSNPLSQQGTVVDAANQFLEEQHLQEVEHEETREMVFNEGIIIVFVMLITYMAFEAFKHKHHLRFGHEASLVCLLGLGISYLFLRIGQPQF